MSHTSRHDAAYRIIQQHAPPELAARYIKGMELYAHVAQGHGQPVFGDDGKPVKNKYDDGSHTYYSYRIQQPKDVDRTLSYPLCQYWSSVGISGWDVVRGVAHGIGIEFDAVGANHAKGLTDEELAEVLAALRRLPYVEVRRSTSGSGYHVWIWFTPDNLPPVTSRPQLKSLCRAVMQRMAQDTGYDFPAHVDHAGDILWICAKRATSENGGLSLVQAASEPLTDWPLVTNEASDTPAASDKQDWSWLPSSPDFELDPVDRHKILDALAKIDPRRADHYPDWFKVGCALKSAGDELFPLFDFWSKSSSKYRNGDTKSLWDSIRPDGITVGSLYHWAKEDQPKSEQPEQKPESKLTRYRISDLLAKYPFPRAEVIEGLLRRGDVANIIGGPKARKSFMVGQLAICVAAGIPFLGWPTARGKVLLVDNELKGDDISSRLPAIAKALGVRWTDVDASIDIMPLRGTLANLYTIRDEVLSYPSDTYSLAIIDALYKSLPAGTDENSNSNMTVAYVTLDELAERHNCATVVVHHTSKGNQAAKSVTDIGAGGGAQSRSVDAHIVLRDHEDKDTVVLEAAVRSQRPVSPVCLVFDYPVWSVALDKNPQNISDAKRKPLPTLDAFLATIPTEHANKKETLAWSRDKLMCAKDTLAALVHEAEQRNLIETVKPKNKSMPHTIKRLVDNAS